MTTTNQKTSTAREPLFRIAKRTALPKYMTVIIYAVSILVAVIVSSLICALCAKEDPFKFFPSLFKGVFMTERKIWIFLRDAMILLGVSIAIVPAFKMKFWNLGGNGQILVGALTAYVCMYFFGGKWNNALVILLMCVASILAGAIWAVIPAIFKAFFNTNESLFTLMMNYIAQGLVTLCIAILVKGGSGTLMVIPDGKGTLPIVGNQYLLPIFVFAVITAFMFVYLRYSKQGYEVGVVGESINTAKYIGLNVKKVYIRTLAISGAICGVVGLILAGGVGHTVAATTHNNMGFTAIMTTWLGNCDPLIMIGTCFLITFFTKGMEQVRMDYGFTNASIGNLVLGIIYLFIIACGFFTRYKLVFRGSNKKGGNA